MLSPNAAHNPFFRLVTVDELPPLPLTYLPLPIPRPPHPQTNIPPVPVMMVGFGGFMMNLLIEVR